MGIDYSRKNLGKHQAKTDSAVPMLMSLIEDPEGPSPAPETQNWYSSIAEWPMDNNDTDPDCTSAAVAHAIQQWTLYGQNMSIIMQASAVLALYNLTKAPEGDGAYLIDVLKFWLTTGVDTGFGIHKIAAFARIDAGHTEHTKCAITWFGNLVVGLALPLAARTQEVWTVVSGAASGVGTWGGHCVLLVGYDAAFIYFVSWGKLMKMTWGFYTTYCDEAYVVMTQSFMKPPGTTPAGISWSTLRQRMRVLKAAV